MPKQGRRSNRNGRVLGSNQSTAQKNMLRVDPVRPVGEDKSPSGQEKSRIGTDDAMFGSVMVCEDSPVTQAVMSKMHHRRCRGYTKLRSLLLKLDGRHTAPSEPRTLAKPTSTAHPYGHDTPKLSRRPAASEREA